MALVVLDWELNLRPLQEDCSLTTVPPGGPLEGNILSILCFPDYLMLLFGAAFLLTWRDSVSYEEGGGASPFADLSLHFYQLEADEDSIIIMEGRISAPIEKFAAHSD